MKKILFEAIIELNKGNNIKGPVTSEDNEEYLFVNKFTALDFYVVIKNKDNSWHQSGGPSIQWPQKYVDSLGKQIEEFLKNTTSFNHD